MKKENDITYSYSRTIEILKGSDDNLKPFAILCLERIEDCDYDLLIKHLTNCDGRIREIVSMKLVTLAQPQQKYFGTLTDALCDVNPNVARNIVELIEFKKLDMQSVLIERVEEILCEIEESSKPKKWKTQKNHALNKKFFNLYWCLEGLCACLKESEFPVKILNECADFDDYTIREKAAKILSRMENPPRELLEKLQNDDNFYVKMSAGIKM